MNKLQPQPQSFIELSKSILSAHLNIFKYLNLADLMRAKKVCKTWSCFANESSLWKSVKLGDLVINDWKVFFTILSQYQTRYLDLTSMRMEESNKEQNGWINFLVSIPKVKSLEELHLCSCPAFVIDGVIESCPRLEVLRLIDCNLSAFKGLSNLHKTNGLKHTVLLNLKLGIIEIEDKAEKFTTKNNINY